MSTSSSNGYTMVNDYRICENYVEIPVIKCSIFLNFISLILKNE